MSGPRQARTVDPRIKSPLLYRLSYRPHTLTKRDTKVKHSFDLSQFMTTEVNL